MAATRQQALRIMRAVLTVYGDPKNGSRPVGADGDPTLLEQYTVDVGVAGFGIVWPAGPVGWAHTFRADFAAYLKRFAREFPGRAQLEGCGSLDIDDYAVTQAVNGNTLAVL